MAEDKCILCGKELSEQEDTAVCDRCWPKEEETWV